MVVSRSRLVPLVSSIAVLALTAALPAQSGEEPSWPGPQVDGSVLLPSGWSLTPHGSQLSLPSDLAVRSALHPGGRWLAVQHCGYRRHMVSIVDLGKDPPVVAAEIPLGRSWSGMTWSRDGAALFVSGGVTDRVLGFDFAEPPKDGESPAVKERAAVAVGDPRHLDLVAGIATEAEGGLWVCLQRGHRLLRLDAESKVTLDVDLGEDSYPFECLPDREGKRVFVSLWGKARVAVVDVEKGAVVSSIPTGQHPVQMVLGKNGARLFVGNANENTVTIADAVTGKVEETISTALHPLAPPGATPNALAISPDGEYLAVANADNNDLAIFEIEERGGTRALGFVPVGQYPTAVCFFGEDGDRIAVANGKGSTGSRANPHGPQPEPGHKHEPLDYSGALFGSSLSVFDLPVDKDLVRLSAQVYANCPLDPAQRARGVASRPADSPIPARPGDPSPIRHVVYVIRENRTYDQVLGDAGRGQSDPSLCLFPREITPNAHAITDQFVLLDNFYVESEVSADGHEWTMGAYATDFVERTWPVTYGGKHSAKQQGGQSEALGYPSEGHYAIAAPKSGYLFDLAHASGVSFRTYGEFVGASDGAAGGPVVRFPVLEGHYDPQFRSWDLDYSDVDRARRFLDELHEFEQKGDYPQLVVLRLPNDHTKGTATGALTPRAYVAQNDAALGMALEGLSKSKFWSSMVVFVVEDDAQNGPDHIDAHRSVGLVAGPYVKRGALVSTMYSTCSMLRTMELILGLPPMTQFDAAARPMWDCFTGTPDPKPYVALPAQWNLEERNGKTSWGASMSDRFDFTAEDAADDLLLGEVVWRSVRGADSAMPAPRRAAFVRAFADEDD
ncbi:MAG: bifunctional YncE family protein/alkaline phosphatase family protein [Planctomycetota bacterium]